MSARARWMPALAGIAAVAFGLGLAELAAGLLAPRASPVLVVGSLLIDLAPPWAKDAAIALFGTGDKVALLVGVGIVLLVLAALAGILHVRRPLLARLLVIAGGVFGMIAAATREGAGVADILPAAAATVAAVLALGALLSRRPTEEPRAGDPDRRSFLVWAGDAGAIGLLGAVGGFALQSGARTVTAVRETFRLPRGEARAKAREWFDRFPKAAYMTEIEFWRELDDDVIEFTIRRLPSAD